MSKKTEKPTGQLPETKTIYLVVKLKIEVDKSKMAADDLEDFDMDDLADDISSGCDYMVTYDNNAGIKITDTEVVASSDTMPDC